nr:hypothetical protein [Mammaliicoccus sp. Marseille-Q6498]
MLENVTLVDDKKSRKQIVNQFYKGLNHETIHDAVTSLEERKHKSFAHGAVYFQNDLTKEEQEKLNLSKSDGLFIIEDDKGKSGAVVSLQIIVQYLASNRETITTEKELSLIQLENIIDRLELTLKSEDL